VTTTRICNTPGCGRSCPSSEHAYCSDCVGTVLRTSRPPAGPSWRRRIEDPEREGATMCLAGKDLTGALAA
jgi:hypothetical protein